MRFHLSTLLLAMVIVALGLGWYLDHNDPRRTEIVGTWHFPYKSLPYGQMGYYTMLTIYEDGTFTKEEIFRSHSDTYEGTYHVEKDGIINFHVVKKTIKTDLDEHFSEIYKKMNQDPPPKRLPITLDVNYELRCAVDKAGFLLLENLSFHFDEDSECKIRWNGSLERSK